MYEILLWELKLVLTVFDFAIKIKLKKSSKMILPQNNLFYQKSSFYPQDFQILYFPLPVYLIWSKGPKSLEISLGFKTWSTIYLGSELKTFGLWVEALV